MNERLILGLLLSFCIFTSALAQTKPAAPAAQSADDKDDVVRITTNLVQIDAVVTKNGKAVTDLKAEDFEIYEDGKKQTITSFAYISNVPGVPTSAARDSAAPKKNETGVPPTVPIQRNVSRRTVAIVVDDLGLSAESMVHVRRQVRKFIAEQVQPNDLVAVIRTGGEMGALQQFTNDKRMLNRAVEMLRWNPCGRVGVMVLPRVEAAQIGGCHANSTVQTLRAVRFILNAMGQLPGRKSIILMSDDIPVRREEPGTVSNNNRDQESSGPVAFVHQRRFSSDSGSRAR